MKARDEHEARFKALLNGKLAMDIGPLRSDWREISIPLASVPANKTFVCEIQLHLNGPKEADFDANTFRVMNRRFEGSSPPAARPSF